MDFVYFFSGIIYGLLVGGIVGMLARDHQYLEQWRESHPGQTDPERTN